MEDPNDSLQAVLYWRQGRQGKKWAHSTNFKAWRPLTMASGQAANTRCNQNYTSEKNIS